MNSWKARADWSDDQTMKNKKIPIEKTIGTGLTTLLAKNLKMIEMEDLPPPKERHDSDVSALVKLREVLGDEIKVVFKPDRTIDVYTANGIIQLTS